MRKFLIILSTIFVTKFAFSQDVITLKNGDKLKVKVLQVDKERVTYTKLNDTESKIYTVDISEVIIIIFEKDNEKYKKITAETETAK